MRDTALFTPPELLRLYRSDARALLVIMQRHRATLTPLEVAVLDAIALEHGIERGEIPG